MPLRAAAWAQPVQGELAGLKMSTVSGRLVCEKLHLPAEGPHASAAEPLAVLLQGRLAKRPTTSRESHSLVLQGSSDGCCVSRFSSKDQAPGNCSHNRTQTLSSLSPAATGSSSDFGERTSRMVQRAARTSERQGSPPHPSTKARSGAAACQESRAA